MNVWRVIRWNNNDENILKWMRYTLHKQRVHIHFTQTLQLAYQYDNKYVYYKKNKGDLNNHTNFDYLFFNWCIRRWLVNNNKYVKGKIQSIIYKWIWLLSCLRYTFRCPFIRLKINLHNTCSNRIWLSFGE